MTPKKKGSDRETDRVKVWMKHPLAARFISQLHGNDFAKYREERLAEGISRTRAINRAMSSTGELTTHKGALWHAWKVTSDRPGASSDWQPKVKHARD